MSDSMASKDNTTSPPLSAEDVIAWLRDNPNFLHKHPEACDLLAAPRGHKGKGVVDFQKFMVERLREDRKSIIEEAREIVETSRANMSNQARIHRAVLLMLEARNFEDFIHTIVMDLTALLDIDIIALIVEAHGETLPHINLQGVHAVTAGTINLLMKDSKIVLESNIKGLEDIYGGGAGLVKSQALLRLSIAPGGPSAMLAFGSRDPALFQPGQGTELTLFLGGVIERCFRAWLDI